MSAAEQSLAGGNASRGVVRVAGTVRKPWQHSTESTVNYISHLLTAGLDVPRPLGRDDQGRQIIEFVPGTMAQDLHPLDLSSLRRVGAMVRTIHDASATYSPSATAWDVLIPVVGADLICHNDLAPWNLVVGERWTFIDWDGAGPSTRLWDLAYSAQSFCGLNPPQSPTEAAGRLRVFVDSYDADQPLRAALPRAIAARSAAMYAMLRDSHSRREEPWASMFVNGHGDYWSSVTKYVQDNELYWRRALI